MQDSYAGDAGDFGKFVMLDMLYRLGGSAEAPGINWYYVPAPARPSNDGRHVGYLQPESSFSTQFRDCSPVIYRRLQSLVASGRRSVRELESSGLLPTATRYYREAVPPDRPETSDGATGRNRWFADSLRALRDCSILFLDPDNSIQPREIVSGQMRSVKYAYFEELREYFEAGKSLIVYNHRDRSPREKYDAKLRMARTVTCAPAMHVVRFRRYSVRDYILLPQPHHVQLFASLASGLTSPPVDILFHLYIPDGRTVNERDNR